MPTRREALKTAALLGFGCLAPAAFRGAFAAAAEALDFNDFFAKALAADRRKIFVPKGRYRVSRTLRVPSGTRIVADPRAIITLADGAATRPGDYLLTNENHAAGDADISVEGGVWDGNNRGNPRPPGLFDAGYTGTMFHFQNVRGLSLKNLTLRNAEAYYTRYTDVRDFHVEDIRFDSDNVRPNNDGVHLGGNCRGGIIRRVRGLRPGVTGDDLVALNADDASNRTEVRGMGNGPITDIEIEDLAAEDCHNFVRLLSVWSPIRNVKIRRVRGTAQVSALNADAARGARVPLFDPKNPPYPDGVGLLEDIDAADFRVAKSKANDIALLRLETRMKNFRVADFERVRAEDKAPDCPTLRIREVRPEAVLVDGRKVAEENGAWVSTEWTIDRLTVS